MEFVRDPLKQTFTLAGLIISGVERSIHFRLSRNINTLSQDPVFSLRVSLRVRLRTLEGAL